MPFALVVEVDNSGEDPEEGRRRLREELAPAVKQLPGFRSLLFMTAFDRGCGVGVVAVVGEGAGMAVAATVGTRVAGMT